MEKNFWIYMVLHKELTEDKKFTSNNTDEEYYSPQTNNYTDSYFSEESLLNFISHFYNSFRFSHGSLKQYFTPVTEIRRLAFSKLFGEFF